MIVLINICLDCAPLNLFWTPSFSASPLPVQLSACWQSWRPENNKVIYCQFSKYFLCQWLTSMVGFVVLYCDCLLIYGPFMHVKFYHTYTPSHLLEMLLIIFYMIIIGLKLFAKKILNYFKDLSYTVKKEVFWAKL